jgi:hypothetical protein
MVLFLVPERANATFDGRWTGFRVGRGDSVGRRVGRRRTGFRVGGFGRPCGPAGTFPTKSGDPLMVGVGRKTLVSSRVGVGRRMLGRAVSTGRSVVCCGSGVGAGTGRDVGGGVGGIVGATSPPVNVEVATGTRDGILVSNCVGGRCGCCVGTVRGRTVGRTLGAASIETGRFVGLFDGVLVGDPKAPLTDGAAVGLGGIGFRVTAAVLGSRLGSPVGSAVKSSRSASVAFDGGAEGCIDGIGLMVGGADGMELMVGSADGLGLTVGATGRSVGEADGFWLGRTVAVGAAVTVGRGVAVGGTVCVGAWEGPVAVVGGAVSVGGSDAVEGGTEFAGWGAEDGAPKSTEGEMDSLDDGAPDDDAEGANVAFERAGDDETVTGLDVGEVVKSGIPGKHTDPNSWHDPSAVCTPLHCPSDDAPPFPHAPLVSPTWLTAVVDSLYRAGPPSLALLFTNVVSTSRARPDSPRWTAPPVVLARLFCNTTSRSSNVPMASMPPPRSAPLLRILVLPSTRMADPTSPRIAPPVLCNR